MAYSVFLSYSAEEDRDGIVFYLLGEFKSPQAAVHFMDALDEAIASLETVPESFPSVSDSRLTRMGYRKVLFMNYLALFRIEGDEVKVVRIFHQSQDYAKLV